MSNVANVDRGPIDRLDGKVVQPLDCFWGAVRIDLVLKCADLRRSRREDKILGGYCIHHFGRG